MGVVMDFLFSIQSQLWLNSHRLAIPRTLRGVMDAILVILTSCSRLADPAHTTWCKGRHFGSPFRYYGLFVALK
jgi:hypothetical protein